MFASFFPAFHRRFLQTTWCKGVKIKRTSYFAIWNQTPRCSATFRSCLPAPNTLLQDYSAGARRSQAIINSFSYTFHLFHLWSALIDVCMKAPTARRLKEHYVEIKLSSGEGTSSTSRDSLGSEIKILLNVCLQRVICVRVCVACLKRCWILTLTCREPFVLARSPQNYLCARREVLSQIQNTWSKESALGKWKLLWNRSREMFKWNHQCSAYINTARVSVCDSRIQMCVG